MWADLCAGGIPAKQSLRRPADCVLFGGPLAGGLRGIVFFWITGTLVCPVAVIEPLLVVLQCGDVQTGETVVRLAHVDQQVQCLIVVSFAGQPFAELDNREIVERLHRSGLALSDHVLETTSDFVGLQIRCSQSRDEIHFCAQGHSVSRTQRSLECAPGPFEVRQGIDMSLRVHVAGADQRLGTADQRRLAAKSGREQRNDVRSFGEQSLAIARGRYGFQLCQLEPRKIRVIIGKELLGLSFRRG